MQIGNEQIFNEVQKSDDQQNQTKTNCLFQIMSQENYNDTDFEDTTISKSRCGRNLE